MLSRLWRWAELPGVVVLCALLPVLLVPAAHAQGDITHAIPGGPVPPAQSAPAPAAQSTFPGATPLAPLPPPGAASPLPAAGLHAIQPVTVPQLEPGVVLLLGLEGRFAEEVAAGGGKAFARWMADDAVTLSNGQPPVTGRAAIAASATWDPRQYRLSWTTEGARMGPSGDMGFTWGRYQGRTFAPASAPGGTPDAAAAAPQDTVTSGRYLTVWRRQPDGSWKVELASSSNAPPSP